VLVVFEEVSFRFGYCLFEWSWFPSRGIDVSFNVILEFGVDSLLSDGIPG